MAHDPQSSIEAQPHDTALAAEARTGQRAAQIAPNTDESIAFLQNMQSGGPWHLVAIADRWVEGASLSNVGDLRRWIDECQGKRNVYFHVNRLRHKPPRGKATKQDLADVAFLHVDVDDPRPEALERVRTHLPAPTVVINSG